MSDQHNEEAVNHKSIGKRVSSFLIHPLFVGIICTCLGASLTYIYTSEFKRLSYTVEPVEKFLNKNDSDKIDISINGVPVEGAFNHRVKCWNSGNLPLKKVPVRVIFPIDEQHVSDFKILRSTFSTFPEVEFGKITQDRKDDTDIRMVIELMNSGDSVEFGFLTNHNMPPNIYSKSEGVLVTRELNVAESKARDKKNAPLIMATSLLSLIVSFYIIFKLIDNIYLKE